MSFFRQHFFFLNCLSIYNGTAFEMMVVIEVVFLSLRRRYIGLIGFFCHIIQAYHKDIFKLIFCYFSEGALLLQ